MCELVLKKLDHHQMFKGAGQITGEKLNNFERKKNDFTFKALCDKIKKRKRFYSQNLGSWNIEVAEYKKAMN